MGTSHFFPDVAGTYRPAERPKKRVPARGYSLQRAPRRATLLTDHEVLEARWLNEFGGWTLRRVRDHYGLPDRYVRQLLDYGTRTKLFPRRDDFPAGYQPTARRAGLKP